jgi:hypothetical protein
MNELRITYDVDSTDNTALKLMGDDQITVTNTYGFSDSLRWDGQTTSPYIEYQFETGPVNVTSTGVDGFSYYANSRYVLAPLPRSRDAVRYSPQEQGIVQGNRVFLGNFQSYERNNGCHTIQLVVPEGVHPRANVTEAVELLSTVDQHFQSGNRPSRVVGFVLDTNLPRDIEGYASDNTFVVSHQAPLSEHNPRNTWVHEYVHTRQQFDYAYDSEWIREASAQYYEVRLPYEVGFTDEDTYNVGLLRMRHKISRDTTLVNQSSWRYSTPYYRGGVVLAVLDQQVRENSDGEYTLEHILWGLQKNYSGQISESLLTTRLEYRTNNSYSTWFQTYAHTSKVPPLGVQATNTLSLTGIRVWLTVYPWLILFLVLPLGILTKFILKYR